MIQIYRDYSILGWLVRVSDVCEFIDCIALTLMPWWVSLKASDE